MRSFARLTFGHLGKRQVLRLRTRFAGSGAAGVVHGNDQHFTETLVEVEGLIERQTVRRIPRSAGGGSLASSAHLSTDADDSAVACPARIHQGGEQWAVG